MNESIEHWRQVKAERLRYQEWRRSLLEQGIGKEQVVPLLPWHTDEAALPPQPKVILGHESKRSYLRR